MKNKIKEVFAQCAVYALGSFLSSLGNGLTQIVAEQASNKAAEKVANINWKEKLTEIK